MSKLFNQSIVLLLLAVNFAYSQADLAASKALIKRIIPQKAQYFEVANIPQENGKDVF